MGRYYQSLSPEINAIAYTLELNIVTNETIVFSDLPERIVMTVSTNDFVGNWSAGKNSFSAAESNNALIVKDMN